MPIHFGTSGWRAIIGDEFTFSNVRKVSWAIAKYIRDRRLQNKGIIVGYDTRFLSGEFARVCARTIAAGNIKVFLTVRDTPTPVIAYQILERKAAGAINITASHNPPQYNGIKFSSAYGGPASIKVTEEIERNIRRRVSLSSGKKSPIKMFDPRPAYLARIKQLVNFRAIRKAGLRIGVDVLHGTGRGYLDRLHSAKEFAGESGHTAGRLAAGAAILFDAPGAHVGDEADEDTRYERHYGDKGVDAQHHDQGNHP